MKGCYSKRMGLSKDVDENYEDLSVDNEFNIINNNRLQLV